MCVCVCVSGPVLGKMVSDNRSCLCLSCDAEVTLPDLHGVRASLALASQQNNKHASQANSSCHVVNGLRYTSWRPAEAFDLRGGITNTPVLGVYRGLGMGAGRALLGTGEEWRRFFFLRRRFVSGRTGM